MTTSARTRARAPLLMQRVGRICDHVMALCRTSIDDHKVSVFPIVPARSTVFSRGSVFLLGDAAITAHFITGLGANTGLQEADYFVAMLRDSPDGSVDNAEFDAMMEWIVRFTISGPGCRPWSLDCGNMDTYHERERERERTAIARSFRVRARPSCRGWHKEERDYFVCVCVCVCVFVAHRCMHYSATSVAPVQHEAN